ncbi:MAG: hypothetical protein ACJAY8_001319 [Sphingobacteriales bacterium]|jgi:hypothetical protein
MKKNSLKNLVLFTLLIIGYYFMYYTPLDSWIHPDKDVFPSSKVTFIYQQF